MNENDIARHIFHVIGSKKFAEWYNVGRLDALITDDENLIEYDIIEDIKKNVSNWEDF